jgi:hypothetical protein
LRETDKGVTVQTEVGGDAAGGELVEVAGLERCDVGRGDLGATGQISIIDPEAALSLGDDIVEIIF